VYAGYRHCHDPFEFILFKRDLARGKLKATSSTSQLSSFLSSNMVSSSSTKRASLRQRGKLPANQATKQCVYFRVLVLKARADVYDAAPNNYVHSKHLRGLVVAEIQKLVKENPDYKQIVDTLKRPLDTSTQEVLRQIGTRDKQAKSVGYFYLQTKRLGEDPGKHLGSCCVRCKQTDMQGAVYGEGNLTGSGDPTPKANRTNRSFPKGHSRSKIIGYDYRNGMRPITTQHAVEMPEVQEAIDEWGRIQLRKGQQQGWKPGAKKAKKDNQEHLDNTALLDMMGDRRSGRRMNNQRMLAFNTPTQAVENKAQRLAKESSGLKPRRYRSGLWGKDAVNADKIVAEVVARYLYSRLVALD
jgi:hypothetical protein